MIINGIDITGAGATGPAGSSGTSGSSGSSGSSGINGNSGSSGTSGSSGINGNSGSSGTSGSSGSSGSSGINGNSGSSGTSGSSGSSGLSGVVGFGTYSISGTFTQSLATQSTIKYNLIGDTKLEYTSANYGLYNFMVNAGTYSLKLGTYSNYYILSNDLTTIGSTGSGLTGSFTLQGTYDGNNMWITYKNNFIPLPIGSVAPPPAFSYLLDDYGTSAYMAYSTRKLKSTYTGDCLVVRRSSDNATQSIGFASNVLDTASLTSFVGAGDGYVTTFYDQTGNGRNATQTNTSYQPRIVVSGTVQTQNSKASIKFTSASSHYLDFGNSSALAQPFTAFSAFTKNDGDASRHLFDGPSRALIGFVPQLCIYAGAGVVSTGAYSTSFQLVAGIFDGASSSIESNGNSPTTGNPGSAQFDAGQNLMAAVDGPGLTIDGYLSEIIIYSANKSTDKANIKSNINTYYSIY